jgi:hypothetical protein
MAASEAAIAAVMEALGYLGITCSCEELDTCDGVRRCDVHACQWPAGDRGCPVAVAAADAAVDADRASIQAETLREAALEVREATSIPITARAAVSAVLMGRARRLTARANRAEGKP